MTLQAARQPIILDRTIKVTREVTETVAGGDLTLSYGGGPLSYEPAFAGDWALRTSQRTYFDTGDTLAAASLADTLLLEANDTIGNELPPATAPFDLAVTYDDESRSIRWTVTASESIMDSSFDGTPQTYTSYTLSAPRVTGTGDLDRSPAVVFYGLPAQEVTNDVQVETWAARVDPAPADDRVIREGALFFWTNRVYIVRWRADNLDPDDLDVGTQTYLIDEDGYRRRIVGIQEHGGRRRYHALATEGPGP